MGLGIGCGGLERERVDGPAGGKGGGAGAGGGTGGLGGGGGGAGGRAEELAPPEDTDGGGTESDVGRGLPIELGSFGIDKTFGLKKRTKGIDAIIERETVLRRAEPKSF